MIKLKCNLDRDLTLGAINTEVWSKDQSSIKNPSWGLLDWSYRETCTSGGNTGDPWRAFCLENFFINFSFYFFRQCNLQFLRTTMQEDSIVRSKVFLIDSLEHSSFCLRPQNSMMRKTNISKIIDTTSVSFKNYFLWMYIEMQLCSQKYFYFFKTVYQNIFIWMDKNEVVSISDIAGNLKFMLNELIQLVQIHIGKQLRSQITQRQSGRVTFNYFLEKRHQSFVCGSFSENIQENFVVDGIKEFSHIQLQYPQCPGVVLGQSKPNILQSFYGRVGTFCFSRRPRIKNKKFIPHWFNDPMNSMVHQSVTYRGFMNMATFWILYIKRKVATVFISIVSQILMQLKNMIFKIHFEFSNIFLVGFFSFEFSPCVEQVFQGNDFFKHRYG